MKAPNRYDIFIESLAKQFSNIPNFHLTQEDGPGKVLFDSIVKRTMELHSLKALYINSYIPMALKAAEEDASEISKSKYSSLIQLTEHELKENYFETIRLGYVAVYHKYEMFIQELLINSQAILSDLQDRNMTLEKYIENTFGFKIRDVSYSPSLHKINYICNCTKHYDGYPKKAAKPRYFETFPENKKIEFTDKNFSADIDFLIDHFGSLINIVLVFSMHKMIHENLIGSLAELPEGADKDKILEHKKTVDVNATKLIELLKLI